MNTMRNAILILMAFFKTYGAEFTNLGFDLGPSSAPTTAGDISIFLPGWNLNYQGHAVSTIGVNTFGTLGNAGAAVLNGRFNVLNVPFEGKYSLTLMNGLFDGTVFAWALTQVGVVPSDAKSLWYKTFLQPAEVLLDGREVVPVQIATESGFTVYAADVSAYSGQEIELTFATRATSVESFQDTYGVDSLSFRSVAVPEPTAISLLLFGVGLFGAQRVLMKTHSRPDPLRRSSEMSDS